MSATDPPGGSSGPGKPPWPSSSRDSARTDELGHHPKIPSDGRRHRATRSYVPPVYEHSRTLSTDAEGQLAPLGGPLHGRNQSASDFYFLQSPHGSPDLSHFSAASIEPALDQAVGSRAQTRRLGGSVSKTSHRRRTHRSQQSIANPPSDPPLSIPLQAPLSGPNLVTQAPPYLQGPQPQAPAHGEETQLETSTRPGHNLDDSRELATVQGRSEALKPIDQTTLGRPQRGHRRKKSRRKPTIVAGTNPMDYGSDQHSMGLGIGISPASSSSSPYMAHYPGSQPGPLAPPQQAPFVPEIPYSMQGYGPSMHSAYGTVIEPGYPAELQKRNRGRPFFPVPPGFSPNVPSYISTIPNLPPVSNIPSAMGSSMPSNMPSTPMVPPGISWAAPGMAERVELPESRMTPRIFGSWTPSIGHSAPPYVPYSQLVQQQQLQQPQLQPHMTTLWPDDSEWYGGSPLTTGPPQMLSYDPYAPYAIESRPVAGPSSGPTYVGPPGVGPEQGPPMRGSASEIGSRVGSYSYSPPGVFAGGPYVGERLSFSQPLYPQPLDAQLLRLEEYFDNPYEAAMDIPGSNYSPEAKHKVWSAESVDYLMKLWDAAERYKWKYVSDVLTERQNKRIPLRACKSKFEAMFGETEASSLLGSSLFYVAFRSGWDSIQAVRCIHEQDEREERGGQNEPTESTDDEDADPGGKEAREESPNRGLQAIETQTRSRQPQPNKENPENELPSSSAPIEATTGAHMDAAMPSSIVSLHDIDHGMDYIEEHEVSHAGPDLPSTIEPRVVPMSPSLEPRLGMSSVMGNEADGCESLEIAGEDFTPERMIARGVLETADLNSHSVNPRGCPGPLIRSPAHGEAHS